MKTEISSFLHLRSGTFRRSIIAVTACIGLLGWVVLPSATLVSATATPPKFTLTSIGFPGSAYSEALAISSNGYVTGCSRVSNICHPFLYSKNGMVDLGLPANTPDGAYGEGVNSTGRVAATGYASNIIAIPYTITDQGGNGVWNRLKGPKGKAVGGDAAALNDANTTVGELLSNDQRAKWSGTNFAYSTTTLPTVSHNSWFQAVDNAGDIGGNVNRTVGTGHVVNGYVWQSSGALDRLTLGGTKYDSWASAITRPLPANGKLSVVGQADTASVQGLPALWTVPASTSASSSTTITGHALATLSGLDSGEALGVNTHGWVVGDCSNFESSDQKASLWVSGHVYNLKALTTGATGWTLDSATAINNSDQIVGWGSYQGTITGFLLTPKA